MSPLSLVFQKLRLQRQLRQSELAILLGYRQSYISALELGNKGPPTTEFIGKLTNALALTAEEQQELGRALLASQRKLVIDADSPVDKFWLLNDLRQEWDSLNTAQVKIIRDVLKVCAAPVSRVPEVLVRMKRRPQEAVAM